MSAFDPKRTLPPGQPLPACIGVLLRSPLVARGVRMRRRDFLILPYVAFVTSPLVALAQQVEKPWRIGFLRVGPPPAAFIGGFQKGLREQGFVEGRHFVIEYAIAKIQRRWPKPQWNWLTIRWTSSSRL